MRSGQRTTEDSEVLREDEDAPAVDQAVARDDAVAGVWYLVRSFERIPPRARSLADSLERSSASAAASCMRKESSYASRRAASSR